MTTYMVMHVVCGLVALGLYEVRAGSTDFAKALLVVLAYLFIGPVMLGNELGMALRGK